MPDPEQSRRAADMAAPDVMSAPEIGILRDALGPGWDVAGDLVRSPAGACFPVRGGIPRFRTDDGYNASFALQWARFRTNQLDEVNQTELSHIRFRETGWSREDVAGRLVLEAGCGAGRFTVILCGLGARLLAIDYSSAVEVSRENNAEMGTVAFAQCDILAIPFAPRSFDLVFCHGVLQHTPNPEAAFHKLVEMVRPGGRISVDVYCKDGLIRPWKSKYLWRWLTTRMRPDHLLAALSWFIPKWLPIDTAIKSIPYAGNYLGAIVPCWNYSHTPLSHEQKVQWAVMDTFDALASRYDKPATIADVRRWVRDAGLTEVDVHLGGNGVVANGRRRT